MNIQKRNLKIHPENLIRFFRKLVPMEGTIKIKVTLGTSPSVINMDVDFLVIDTPNIAYDAVLGRTLLNKANVIILTPHLLMKFPTP